MKRNLLLCGALAGIAFFTTVYVVAAFVPNYSHLAETISEIGEVGSPMAIPFQVGMLAVNLLVILFGAALLAFAKDRGLSTVPVYFVLFFGLADIGTNVFPSPHPLHNVFGLSLTIGYMAPIAFAIGWRRAEATRAIARFSAVVALLLFASIFLNISPAFNRDLYPLEYYGAVQRSAFVLFYGWCAYLGITTWSMAR